MSFYERYEKCCRQLNILPASQEAADGLGCTRAYISRLASTGTNPGGDIVKNAAKMLGVSSDYLLGLTDNPVALDGEKLFSPQLQRTINDLQTLNDEGLEAIGAMIRTLVDTGVLKK